MSTTTLEKLLADLTEETPRRYSMSEIDDMIDRSENEFAASGGYTTEEAFRMCSAKV